MVLKKYIKIAPNPHGIKGNFWVNLNGAEIKDLCIALINN